MRILLIRLSALGDVVTASPLPRLIKQHDPDAEVVWAVERRCADAVTGHPWVDEVLALPSSRDWRRWLRGARATALSAAGELWQALRRRPFDVVLDLQGLLKSAAIAALARAERKLVPADAYEPAPFVFTEHVPRVVDPRRVASMYVSLLAPLGIVPREPADYRLVLPIGADDHARMAAWRTGHGLAAGGYLVCAPGTTRPQKHWVAERWAPALAALHRRHGLPAVLVGGPSEQALADTIVAGATSPVVSAVGATSIKETGALFAAAALTVSVDTGPMHMAVAAGCPTLALFGSTRPRLFDDGSRYTCLHRRFACSPCDRRPICRDYDCLRAITPGDVVRAADHLLGER